MERKVCQRFLDDRCTYGDRCKFAHPNPLTDNIHLGNVVIVSQLGSDHNCAMRVKSITGTNSRVLSERYNSYKGHAFNEYAEALNYLNSQGYKVTSITAVGNSMITHLHKEASALV